MSKTTPTWNGEAEAARITRALPDLDWPEFRHTIQTLRETFLHGERKGDCHLLGEASEGPLGKRWLSPFSRPTSTTPEPSDLLTWGKAYLPDHFRKPPSAMHEWMAQNLDSMATHRGQKLNVLGPRGGAKSTVATLAYPLREALHAREPYIWIISDTAHQARAHLDNLNPEP